MVNIKKRGNVYQYQFEIAPVDGKRKYINKSGFKSKREAMEAGVKAYNEYFETGHSFKPSTMSYSDYLDYLGYSYKNGSPREVIQNGFKQGIIKDGELWIEMML